MELTKDIIINTENLAKNSTITINYSGKLGNSETVFINYGYTPNSFNYKKIKLNNNSNISIHLEKPGYFYFYFNDENDNLDNNNSKDYQLYIKTSSLILTNNSSMKELDYRYVFSGNKNMHKTFYTKQTLKNTSKPQEIIIPKAFNLTDPTSESKNINGYILEPTKEAVNYNFSSALIPTENYYLLASNSKSPKFIKYIKKINLSINKLLLSIPKLFDKNC